MPIWMFRFPPKQSELDHGGHLGDCCVGMIAYFYLKRERHHVLIQIVTYFMRHGFDGAMDSELLLLPKYAQNIIKG